MPLSVSKAKKDPDKALSKVTGALDARKAEFFWQVEDDLFETLDDTSIVDRAKETATQGFGKQQERNDRALARYGYVQTAGQRQENNRLSKLAEGASYADTVNNAKLAQFDRNEGVKTQLLSNSRALTGQSIDGLANAASMQTNRLNSYQNARAGYKANKYNTIASIGGAALTAAALIAI